MAATPPLVVYTALFGDGSRDRLGDVRAFSAHTRFVCYTDVANLAMPGWGAVLVAKQADPRRAARQIKICPPLWDEEEPPVWTMWLDASLTPRVDPHSIVRNHCRAYQDMVLFKHTERDCAYEEHEACHALKLDDPAVMAMQMARYQTWGFPRKFGLAETGVVLRRTCATTRAHADAWLDELARGSVRDQLSFDYACWKTSTTYGHFPGSIRSPVGQYFEYRKHKR